VIRLSALRANFLPYVDGGISIAKAIGQVW
jgi:hypothetical protein